MRQEGIIADLHTTHWWLGSSRAMGGILRKLAFCGTGKNRYLRLNFTADKYEVTCRKCRRMMKIHGHLPKEEF
jgi:hypothetical protein